MKETEVVRFWLNNWTCGETYPNEEPFTSWFKDDLNIQLADINWVRENELCVKIAAADMSIIFDVTAPREWVDKNCPNIYKYPKFLGEPVWSKDQEYIECYEDHFGYKFLEYSRENIGITYTDEDDSVIDVNPLKIFGKKLTELLNETFGYKTLEPKWITATETEVNVWLEEPKFNESPKDNEDFEWYSDSSSPDWCCTFIMTAPMLHSIMEYYNIKEYPDADSNEDYFRQYKVCKEYIGN